MEREGDGCCVALRQTTVNCGRPCKASSTGLPESMRQKKCLPVARASILGLAKETLIFGLVRNVLSL